jgi:hypothetical protein
MSLLGSPLQFVLQSGATGVLVNFLDGDLARVDVLEMDPRQPLAAEWRRLCRDRSIGFVHFVFRLDTMPGAGTGNWAWRGLEPGAYETPPTVIIGARKRLQYYPDNAIAAEIARHFLGLGMVNMLDLLPDLFDS